MGHERVRLLPAAKTAQDRPPIVDLEASPATTDDDSGRLPFRESREVNLFRDIVSYRMRKRCCGGRRLDSIGADDRQNGMGIVVEYAGRGGDPQWAPPPPFKWDYRLLAAPNQAAAPAPDHIIDMFAGDVGDVWSLHPYLGTFLFSSAVISALNHL